MTSLIKSTHFGFKQIAGTVRTLQEQMFPASVPRYHLFVQSFTHSYPGICFAMFIATWAHFYGSGLQHQNVTILLPSKQEGAYNVVVAPFLKFMTVPYLFVEPGADYLVPEMTFAPMGWIDVAEPCTIAFLRMFLVPTVINRIRSAMAAGRGHPNGPWWDPKYDRLILAPPKKIMVLKSPKGAVTRDRMFDLTNRTFLATAERNGFTLLPDTIEGDLRLYFYNHASTIVVNWGSGSLGLAHMYAGGAVLPNEPPATAILLFHPKYNHELDSMQSEPESGRGVNASLRYTSEGGLRIRLEPPNSSPMGIANVYSKIILLDDIGRLQDEHLQISAGQRAFADDPTNQCQPLRDDQIIKPGPPTGFELESEYPSSF
jgi:hypothetical protein